MRKNLLFFICLFLSFQSLAQAPVIEWQKRYGGTGPEYGNAIRQAYDQGYFIAGITSSRDGYVQGHNGYVDMWVVRLDKDGNFVWQVCLGDAGLQEATSIDRTTDGGCIVAGNTTSGRGDRDYFIVKLSGSGTVQWQVILGGRYSDYARSVKQTSDGGYIIAGGSSSNDGDVSGNHGFPGGTFFRGDAWIVKLGSNGQVQWQKCYGGTDSEEANAIIQTSDGGYAMVATATSNDGDVHGNRGGYGDYWVVRMNNAGDTLWTRTFGGSMTDIPTSIKQTSDGGYVVAGYTVLQMAT